MISQNTVSSDKVEIAAPAALVWEVLVDFDSYGKWNSFCPSIEAQLVLDTPVKMQVELGFGLQEQVETMCRIDPGEAIAWRMENKPGDAIHAVRTQSLEVLDEGRCTYISVDEFAGEAAQGMMELMAKPVEDGFNSCAYGLKEYCEQLYSQRKK